MNETVKRKFEAKAKVLKALAHPTRLWLAEQLADHECCVCTLVEALEADFSTISKHLAVLKQAGIVEDEKRGKQVFYRLKVPCVLKFMNCVEAVLESQFKTQAALMDSLH
jgi:ArsR family transcriptional regulator